MEVPSADCCQLAAATSLADLLREEGSEFSQDAELGRDGAEVGQGAQIEGWGDFWCTDQGWGIKGRVSALFFLTISPILPSIFPFAHFPSCAVHPVRRWSHSRRRLPRILSAFPLAIDLLTSSVASICALYGLLCVLTPHYLFSSVFVHLLSIAARTLGTDTQAALS